MGNDVIPFNVGHFNCFAIRDNDEYECNILLIKTGHQQVLIETGFGYDLTTPPYLLPTRLQAAGTSPGAIDVVMFSHADFDHVGGTIDDAGNPAFPHARYVLARKEWAFWSQHPERLRSSETFDEEFRRMVYTIPQERLARFGDRLELIEGNEEVVPGIRLIPAPGHTPGYSVVDISSGDERLLFIGDLILEFKDIENPNWYSVYDFDPKQVVITRHSIFAQAAREQALLMAYHLPFPGLGYVSPFGQGWCWQPFEIKD